MSRLRCCWENKRKVVRAEKMNPDLEDVLLHGNV